MKKAQFNKETSLINLMNSTKQIGALKIACVMWHNNPWKIVDTLEFDIVADRAYTPIAEFRTKDELYAFAKASL